MGENSEESQILKINDEIHRAKFLEELQDQIESTKTSQGLSSRLSIPAPEIQRDGGAHVRVENFGLIAASLRRDPSHILRFLSKEGGLTSSVAGCNSSVLRVKWRGGRGFPARFVSILKK